MQRFFVCLVIYLVSYSCIAATNSKPVLNNLSIERLEQLLQSGHISCKDVVTQYLERIKNYNLNSDTTAPLNAFTELNPSLFNEAKRLDDYYIENKQLLGPLHCVPVVVKDNIDTYDMTTTSGSLTLLGLQPYQDAFIVKKLRAAGAIILGKTAMDELASGMSGLSSRSGRVGNSYDPTQNSGGSSSGSAVAVSADFAVIGIGTDNSGSIRIPAAFNGIYGLRPSKGLLSHTGIFPAGNIDGVPGPMARHVTDLAIALSVLAEHDATDPMSVNTLKIDYVKELQHASLQDKHLGIITQVADNKIVDTLNAASQHQFQQFIKRLQAQGVTTTTVSLDKFNTDRSNNMAGMREDVDAYLQARPTTARHFLDICHGRTRVYGSVEDCEKLIKSLPSKQSNAAEVANQLIENNRHYIEKLMDKNHLDALILPVSRVGTATFDVKDIMVTGELVASNAGLPSITINNGYLNGMPVGIELIGRRFDEVGLLKLAHAYELEAAPTYQPPVLAHASNKSSIAKLNIPQLNNLFTQIGVDSYENHTKKGKKLTPAIIQQTTKRLSKLSDSEINQ